MLSRNGAYMRILQSTFRLKRFSLCRVLLPLWKVWKPITFPLLLEIITPSGLNNETHCLDAHSVKDLNIWSRAQKAVYYESKGSVKGSRALVDYVTGSIAHWNFNLLFWSWNEAMEQKAYTNDLFLFFSFFLALRRCCAKLYAALQFGCFWMEEYIHQG